MKNYIGCSGFSNRDWIGEFYPEDLKSGDYLKYYSSVFNSVEINSTFYHKPTVKTLAKWYAETPETFRFFIKIPKSITHIAKLKDVKEQVADFCKYISSELKEKLGGFLFQLPPSYHFTDENLEGLLDVVNDNYLNVVEFRHASWWNDDVMTQIGERKIVFSGVSIPKNIPDEVVVNHPDILYYRLHGTPVLFKSEYPKEFLDALASQIKKADRTAYIFFNNTWGLGAVRNAKHFQLVIRNY